MYYIANLKRICKQNIGADGKLEAVNVSGPQGLNVQGSRYSPDKSEYYIFMCDI